jgi:hypothetical protein
MQFVRVLKYYSRQSFEEVVARVGGVGLTRRVKKDGNDI